VIEEILSMAFKREAVTFKKDKTNGLNKVLLIL
jgi:hypothetical protein